VCFRENNLVILANWLMYYIFEWDFYTSTSADITFKIQPHSILNSLSLLMIAVRAMVNLSDSELNLYHFKYYLVNAMLMWNIDIYIATVDSIWSCQIRSHHFPPILPAGFQAPSPDPVGRFWDRVLKEMATFPFLVATEIRIPQHFEFYYIVFYLNYPTEILCV
jgi:hypothetical protein